MIVALAGGVGGAKLANGLARRLAPDALVVAVNTGDDFVHLGLHVSPDLDTVMYTLAGVANPRTGWGLAGETWRFMDAIARLGGEIWFKLGDLDLATHVERTRRLAAGESLSTVTAALCRGYGVGHRVVPMSDDPVRTLVDTDEGTLAFQDYFVRRRCEPVVRGIRYGGANAARSSAGLGAALSDPRLRAVVVCPSNPYLSIAPMLAIAEIREQLSRCAAPIVAVSPIIGGAAVKGPAGKIMRELGHPVSVSTVAREYAGWVDALVIDEADRALAAAIEADGPRVAVARTLMNDPDDQARLAAEVLAFAGTLVPRLPRAHR